jgi:endonuclease/exonuclease/phosphatase family metal-dependent hydrolase
VSADLTVRRVDYRFDRSVKLLSDHAVVIADLEVQAQAA